MIHISLFGLTSISSNGRLLTAGQIGGVKQRQILELLAVNLGVAMSKELLAERLWDGHPPPGYVATLESYVCLLRGRLGLGRGPRSALATTTKGYRLDPAQVRVDLVDARAVLQNVVPYDVLGMLDRTPGDLLASEPTAEWADTERKLFSEQVATACTEAAYLALDGGYTGPALRLARTAVKQSYFSEFARRALMHALWRSGERTQALMAYAELRARMLDELGIEPGPASRELYVSILRGEPDGVPADGDRAELATLLLLLRQVLEVTSPSDVPIGPELAKAISKAMASPGLSLEVAAVS